MDFPKNTEFNLRFVYLRLYKGESTKNGDTALVVCTGDIGLIIIYLKISKFKLIFTFYFFVNAKHT